MTKTNDFSFKQFTIQQDLCAMKVTTDACLLGATVDANTADHVLDIGAGSGLLSLMIVQEFNCSVTAVELDDAACKQAQVNVDNSPWRNQIQLHQQSIQAFAQTTKQRFDCIISNPPFFDSSLKCPDSKRNLARHTDSLSFAELTTAISTLLSENGKSWVLLPATSSERYRQEAIKAGLPIEKIIKIRSTSKRPIHRHIVVTGRQAGPVKEEYLTIHDDNEGYSRDVRRIMQPFYRFL